MDKNKELFRIDASKNALRKYNVQTLGEMYYLGITLHITLGTNVFCETTFGKNEFRTTGSKEMHSINMLSKKEQLD
jgi:hypothetical protein